MKTRFAQRPTGSLQIGDALGAVANRDFAETMLLRIDDTDSARDLPGGEHAILEDLRWLGVGWDEGPVRQSERLERYREAAAGLPQRFEGVMLLHDDGSATHHLASVVDDLDFGITHVLRGNEQRSDEALQRALARALGGSAPEVIHYGLVLGSDGKNLSEHAEGVSIASLREEGIPAEAVVAYLRELGAPRDDVQLDLAHIRSLAVGVIALLSDGELATRLGVPLELAPALRGARDLAEARAFADSILARPSVRLPDERATLERFRELRAASPDLLDTAAARELVRELKAVGGHLRALRTTLTGRESGPELSAVVAALRRDETLVRVDAAL